VYKRQEQYHHFALLPTKTGSTFHWLQSLEEPQLAFLVTRIHDVAPDYEPVIDPQFLAVIEANSVHSAEFWGIITVPAGKPEKMTINLQGPVLINRARKLGAQFISEDPLHHVRTPLLELVEKYNTNAAGGG
ncbi:MAG: flagellar assembly protein FliW, partial [Turneriella sp.]|nr:flagellar assembly protein FliW [Turneriella sp.]